MDQPVYMVFSKPELTKLPNACGVTTHPGMCVLIYCYTLPCWTVHVHVFSFICLLTIVVTNHCAIGILCFGEINAVHFLLISNWPSDWSHTILAECTLIECKQTWWRGKADRTTKAHWTNGLKCTSSGRISTFSLRSRHCLDVSSPPPISPSASCSLEKGREIKTTGCHKFCAV